MCLVRIKALLQELTHEVELTQEQGEYFARMNRSMSMDVVRLQRNLHHKDGLPSKSNNQNQLLLFKGVRMPPPPTPRRHQWDLEIGLTPRTPTAEFDGDGHADGNTNVIEGRGKPSSGASQTSEQNKSSSDLTRLQDAPTSAFTQASLQKDFKLWPAWEEALAVLQSGSSRLVRLAHSSHSFDEPALDDSSKKIKYGAELRTSGCVQHLVARPSSPRQILWDLLTMVFMSIDVLMVPMQAFPMQQTRGLKTLDWATVCFWTFDIPNNFLMGFHKGGIFEMRPSKIAKRYARRLFLVDFTLVLVDWVVVLNDSRTGENMGFFRIAKAYRVTRFLRLIRILRIAKMLKLAAQLSDLVAVFHSDAIKILIDISRIFVFILVAAHFLACGWYAIGTMEGFDDPDSVRSHWVKKFVIDQAREPSVFYRYMTSLHWSLTQFTPASMEVVPRNVVERAYAVLVLLLAVVTFSSFMGSITSSMTRLRMMNLGRAKQREDVSRYILEHRMSLSVGNRIMHFLQKQDSMPPPRVMEEDVSLFKNLPEALRVDMHREVFIPVLCPHPFFHHYHEFLDDASFATICHTAVQEYSASKGEYVFVWGETATHMVFTQRGVCEYFLGAAMHNDTVIVEANGMLSEAVLWVQWEHVGRLLAVQHVDLAKLNSAVMQSVLGGQPAAVAARAYALQFVKLHLSQGSYTDLCIDMDSALEMAQNAWASVGDHAEDVATKTVMTQAHQRITRLRSFVKRFRQSFRLTGRRS